MKCSKCGSYAINEHLYNRIPGKNSNICDMCYWQGEAQQARAELERYKETIANMELLLCRPKSCQKHQEVARECIKILRDYNGVEGIADRVMKHFGLDG